MDQKVKKFEFRCCGEFDDEDIQTFLQKCDSPGCTSSSQRFCVEADEYGDDILALAFCSIDSKESSSTFFVHRLVFVPSSIKILSASNISLPLFLLKQLRNVGMQSNCAQVEVTLRDYNEEIVLALNTADYSESEGYFSSEENCMVHKFLFKNNDSNVTLSRPYDEISTFSADNISMLAVDEVEDSADAPPEMKNLISDLFRALHAENR